MNTSQLTGTGNYFEDFVVGEFIKHRRGKTVEPLENVMITNMVMNTAAGHFDEAAMKDTMYGQRLQFGGVTASLVIGMATQDVAENALAEIGMDKIRFKSPVFHGDTLYAYSEVLEKTDSDRDDAGIVRFRHWGVKQDGTIVFEGERLTLIKRKAKWLK